MATVPTLTPVADSAQVKAVGHDGAALYIQFNGGGIYRYPGAPVHHAQDIHGADSKGKYFNQHIRGRYPHEKL